MTKKTLSTYATRIEKHGLTTLVYYHDTPIVVWDRDRITLKTGGWFTPTTKRKMNQVAREYNLPYQVYAKNYKWYVDFKGQTLPFEGGTVTLKR